MQAIEIITNVHNGYIKVPVPFKGKEVRVIVIWADAKEDEKNYNLSQLKKLTKIAVDEDVFANISNPVEWQRQMRNEW